MINYLIAINPSIKIYMFGVYPMFESSTARNILLPFYKYANSRVSELCNNYDNVFYVDVIENRNYVAPHDIHPNFQGQCYMKEQVLRKIIATNK